MTKLEFIEKLQATLEENLPAQDVRSNVNYYWNYIREEEGKGRSEEDILQELGDPRLIARTIVDSEGGPDADRQFTSYEEAPFYRNKELYREEESGQSDGFERSFETAELPRWKLILGLIAAALLIILIVGAVLGAAVKILTSPLFWIAVALILIIRIVNGRYRS